MENKIENMLDMIERLIEKMGEMENKLDMIREMIDNISSEKTTSVNMDVSWDTQTK